MSRGISFELKFQVRFSNVSAAAAAAGTPFARFCNISKRDVTKTLYEVCHIYTRSFMTIVLVYYSTRRRKCMCRCRNERNTSRGYEWNDEKPLSFSYTHPPISLAEMMYRAKAIKKKKKTIVHAYILSIGTPGVNITMCFGDAVLESYPILYSGVSRSYAHVIENRG